MVLFCDYHSPEANLRGRGAPLGGVLFLLGIPTYRLGVNLKLIKDLDYH